MQLVLRSQQMLMVFFSTAPSKFPFLLAIMSTALEASLVWWPDPTAPPPRPREGLGPWSAYSFQAVTTALVIKIAQGQTKHANSS